jgi:hypothetical protein
MPSAAVESEGGSRRAPMSMYAELLAASLDQRPAEGGQEVGDLLAEVIACRQRLGTSSSAVASPEGDLASNIDYDLALIRLAAARGIDTDPCGFDRPGEERRRLEQELARRGVDLNELAADASY